jgi:GMP synthase (glutamine-hydrolysing)
MILVVNCFYEEPFAADFDRVVAGHFQRAGHPSRHVRALDLAAIGDGGGFSRLVISGSIASATEDQPWDRPLADLVRGFMAAGKPVLGICYGHQFLAKVLAGPEHVRRRPEPELGFIRLPLEANPLFAGMAEPTVMVSHFDEACRLPPEFRVLAASAQCAVLAFQYRDLPVWGVQFHPEYSQREGEAIWKEVFRCTPRLIPAPPEDPAGMEQNHLVFRNFAGI